MDERHEEALAAQLPDGKVVLALGRAIAERVTATRRGRLVFTTAITTAIVVSLLFLLIGFAVSEQIKGEDRRHTQTSCEAQGSARPQGNARAFDSVVVFQVFSDAFRLGQKNAKSRVFERAELGAANRRLHSEYAGKVPGQFPPTLTSFAQLGRSIKPIPLLDCKKLAGS